MQFRNIFLLLMLFFGFSFSYVSEGGEGPSDFPGMETILTEPADLTSLSIWVPAKRAGPFINRACKNKFDCIYTFGLPSGVTHRKGDGCPEGIGRILASYSFSYCHQDIPLVLTDNWKWDYSYSESGYKSAIYDLNRRGGGWEGSWEAILNLGVGDFGYEWFSVLPSGRLKSEGKERAESCIEIKTFSSVRLRDGYPKKRKFN